MCDFVESNPSRSRRDARTGLVERDVSVAAKPKDHEADRRLIEERLVASALGFGVDRRAVELVEGAEPEAAQLSREVCAVAALVRGA